MNNSGIYRFLVEALLRMAIARRLKEETVLARKEKGTGLPTVINSLNKEIEDIRLRENLCIDLISKANTSELDDLGAYIDLYENAYNQSGRITSFLRDLRYSLGLDHQTV